MKGKGEFSMTYKCHAPVMPNVQEQLVREYKEKQAARHK
jgi:elongation factor G